MPDDKIYTLILRALPGDDRPPEIRMRRLLKFALRACGFRCKSVLSDNPNETQAPPSTKKAPNDDQT